MANAVGKPEVGHLVLVASVMRVIAGLLVVFHLLGRETTGGMQMVIAAGTLLCASYLCDILRELRLAAWRASVEAERARRAADPVLAEADAELARFQGR